MTEVVVLGAGIVGVSTALALQAREIPVTLVDKKEPGRETSYGNSGLIQGGGADPFTMPREVATLVSYLLLRNRGFRYHWSEVVRRSAELRLFYKSSSPASLAGVAPIYSSLVGRATRDHEPLIEAARASALVRRTGFYRLFRDEAHFEIATRAAERLRAIWGVEFEELSAVQLKSQEPALQGNLAGALLLPQSWSVSDPASLVDAYVRLFVTRGGRVERGDAHSLRAVRSGWTVKLDDGKCSGSDIVVAMGPWSPDLLFRFGYRVPMIWKRGYHSHLVKSPSISRPMADTNRGVMISPVRAGLRVTTGVSLVSRASPADLTQLKLGLDSTRELMGGGEACESEYWMGHRPCMADIFPMVGRAPRHRGLWMNIGHGHHGLTFAPTTGDILAECLATGADPDPEVLSPLHRLR